MYIVFLAKGIQGSRIPRGDYGFQAALRNSVLMTRYYPELDSASASDLSGHVGTLLQPIKADLGNDASHQYGICARLTSDVISIGNQWWCRKM